MITHPDASARGRGARALSCSFFSALFCFGAAAACSGEDPQLPDAGQVEDAAPFDAGSRRDAGGRDVGPKQKADAGYDDPATVVEGIEQLGGVRIYVHVRGTTTSTMPPLLFLNTGPSLGHEYQIEPMSFLLDGRLLVFFDLRTTGRSGFGAVGSTTGVTLDAHIEDVENVVEYVGGIVDAPRVDLLGHGYGAGVAALYARRHPDRVSRLVLTAPYPANILQHAYYHAEVSARLSSADRERFLAITREPDCRGDVQACSLELWNITGPHFLCEQNRALFDTMSFQYADFRSGFLYIDQYLRDTSYDWAPLLEGVAAPTTIVSGPCDPIPADAPATYADRIAGAEHHVIPATGHFPMVEAPAAYQAILRRALIYP